MGSSNFFDNAAGAAGSISTLYDAVIGSTTQVASGAANYSGFSAALFSVIGITGAVIRILRSNITENVTINQQVTVQGSGVGSAITGTLTLGGTLASYSTLEGVFFTGVSGSPAYTINSGCIGAKIIESFQGGTIIPVDNGSGNYLEITQQ